MRSQRTVEHETRLSARQIERLANYGIIPQRMQQHCRGHRGSLTELDEDAIDRIHLIHKCLGRKYILHDTACELFFRFYTLPKPERTREVIVGYLEALARLFFFGWKRGIPEYTEAYRGREDIKRHVAPLTRDPAVPLLGSPEVVSEIISELLSTIAGIPSPGTLEYRAGWPALETLRRRVLTPSALELDQAVAHARERLQRDEERITAFVSAQLGDPKVVAPMIMCFHTCAVPHTLREALLPFATLAELAPTRTAEERSRQGQSLTSELSGTYPIRSALRNLISPTETEVMPAEQ